MSAARGGVTVYGRNRQGRAVRAGVPVTAVLLLVGLSGCRPAGSSVQPTAGSKVQAAPSPPVTAAAPSPGVTAGVGTVAPIDRVPDDMSVIDAAYVERVMAVLEGIQLEAARAALAAGRELNEDVLLRVLAVWAGHQEGLASQEWQHHIIPHLQPEPSAPTLRVVEVVTVRADCVSALVEYDPRPMSTYVQEAGWDPTGLWYLVLVPKDPGDGAAADFNPTGWELVGRLVADRQDGRIDDPCSR